MVTDDSWQMIEETTTNYHLSTIIFSFMEIPNLIPHIEALIFASEKPLTSAEIMDLINQAFSLVDDKIVIEQVDAALEGIVEKYSSEFYPFEIRQSGGGWQFLTKKEYHRTVAQLNGEKYLKRLSAAALETLAIIAYKQPITKGEIEAIRGVSSDYSVQKLLEKELIVISGRNEKLPGHPLVYSTSKAFMDYFGINSPEDLPKIKEILSDQVVEPTIVNPTDFEQSETLAVSDTGELMDAGTTEGEESHLNGHSFKELDPDSVDDASENFEAAQNPEPDITHQANNETIDEEGATDEDVERARLFIEEMHHEDADLDQSSEEESEEEAPAEESATEEAPDNDLYADTSDYNEVESDEEFETDEDEDLDEDDEEGDSEDLEEEDEGYLYDDIEGEDDEDASDSFDDDVSDADDEQDEDEDEDADENQKH